MATRKYRKSRPRKSIRRRQSVRGHRQSTAGMILPLVDVRTLADLPMFEKAMNSNTKKACMVWAIWCPHCHTMMPHFDAAAKSPDRSIQAIKVEEKMLPAVNEILTTKVNKNAKPINVEGYPSIILVDDKGNKMTDIEPVRDTKVMTKVMNQVGPLANAAGLSGKNEKEAVEPNANNASNMANMLGEPSPPNASKANNVNKANKANKGNKNILANIGIANEGLAAAPRTKNIDIGEDTLLGSLAAEPNKNKGVKLNSIPVNKMNNTGKNRAPMESLKAATAPSSINTTPPSAAISTNSTKASNSVPTSMKKLSEQVERETSMIAPLSPPSMNVDLDMGPGMSEIEGEESISNNLSAEQRVSGGGRRGGSLYAAMARTTYTLAPAAALLATAAMVMKGKRGNAGKRRGTHRRAKKSRRISRRR